MGRELIVCMKCGQIIQKTEWDDVRMTVVRVGRHKKGCTDSKKVRTDLKHHQVCR